MPLSDDDPSLVPVFVTYSLAMLPDEPITPRALDPRVGYFYHAYTDLGDHRQNTNMTHFLRHESEGVDTRIRVRGAGTALPLARAAIDATGPNMRAQSGQSPSSAQLIEDFCPLSSFR